MNPIDGATPILLALLVGTIWLLLERAAVEPVSKVPVRAPGAEPGAIGARRPPRPQRGGRS